LIGMLVTGACLKRFVELLPTSFWGAVHLLIILALSSWWALTYALSPNIRDEEGNVNILLVGKYFFPYFIACSIIYAAILDSLTSHMIRHIPLLSPADIHDLIQRVSILLNALLFCSAVLLYYLYQGILHKVYKLPNAGAGPPTTTST